MAKDDKTLGKWIATAIVNTTTIKRYANGFSIHKRGELITEKIKYKQKTTTHEMVEMIAKIAGLKKLKHIAKER
jgi:hypothetical protein